MTAEQNRHTSPLSFSHGSDRQLLSRSEVAKSSLIKFEQPAALTFNRRVFWGWGWRARSSYEVATAPIAPLPLGVLLKSWASPAGHLPPFFWNQVRALQVDGTELVDKTLGSKAAPPLTHSSFIQQTVTECLLFISQVLFQVLWR